jgi:hypothetical protein
VTTPKLDPDKVPTLEGWVTISDVSDQMKLSRNGVRKRVFGFGEFAPDGDQDPYDSIRKIMVGGQVIYLLRREEVDREVEKELRDREVFQTERAPEISFTKQRREQRRLIVVWGRENGYIGPELPENPVGRLTNKLIAAWSEATGITPIV